MREETIEGELKIMTTMVRVADHPELGALSDRIEGLGSLPSYLVRR